jgi:hypothetical protein
MLSEVNNKEKKAVIFYFHPWEIDIGQPKVKNLSKKDSFRHYVNIKTMEQKLNSLMSDFCWDRMDKIFLKV